MRLNQTQTATTVKSTLGLLVITGLLGSCTVAPTEDQSTIQSASSSETKDAALALKNFSCEEQAGTSGGQTADELLRQKIAEISSPIRHAIHRNWYVPSNSNSNDPVVVGVRLDRNGEVLRTWITESSGNALYNRSAIAAIGKSSPLPIPDDPNCHKYFETILLNMRAA